MEIIVKKLSAILLCFIMLITLSLAGCAGFELDKVKYYNEVLAKVGNTNITRFELISTHNSYTNSNISTGTQTLDDTLEILVNRELLYQYALGKGDVYKPTPNQINQVIQAMFDSLDEEMEDYITDAKKILNIKTETKDDEKTDETAYLRQDYNYTPRAKVKYENNKYVIVYELENEPEYPDTVDQLIATEQLENFTQDATISAIKTAYLNHLLDTLVAEDSVHASAIQEKVISLFAKNLISYEHYLRDESGNAYNKVTSDLLFRYFKRNFESRLKSQYISNIRETYLKTEELSVDELVDEFNYIYNLDKNAYQNKQSAYIKKIVDIGTKGNDLIYHPQTDSQFGYFIHTLIKFDTLEDEFKALKNEKDGEKYDIEYGNLLSKITVNPRNAETGLVDTDVTVTISQVFEEFEAIQAETDYNTKLNMFIDFMFKYTGDASSTLVSGMPYVVGDNGHSSMEQNFTDEAVSLMKNGAPGAVSNATIDDIDSWCITSYGIHFLMYVEDVSAYDIDPANLPADESVAMVLQNSILNPLTNETYFDMLFDSVYPASSSDEVYTSNTGYSSFEDRLINSAKSNIKVEKFATKIKATKTSV